MTPIFGRRDAGSNSGGAVPTGTGSPARTTGGGGDRFVRVVEVGPRDGLQNESATVPTTTKVELIERLAATGLGTVEATSFVSPKAIPQLADGAQVLARMRRRPGVRYPVLVPNEQGYDRAMEAGADEIAVFTAASETFNRRNTNVPIDESIARFEPIVQRAMADGVHVRGYVSCAFGCPFEGEIAPAAVHDVAHKLISIGIDELSIGDTIGVGVPSRRAGCGELVEALGAESIGLHLHDTRGTALSNVWAGLELGIRTFDASAAGTGGCPFAPGATGNLATEDLVWFLHRAGFQTGVDLDALLGVARWLAGELGRMPAGHVAGVRPFPAPSVVGADD